MLGKRNQFAVSTARASPPVPRITNPLPPAEPELLEEAAEKLN